MVLGIYGSGGAGQDIRDMAELADLWDRLIYIDDTVEKGCFQGTERMPFAAFCQTYKTEEAEIVIAQGEPKYKIALYDKVKKQGYPFTNLIHPSAFVSPSAKLGRGVVILAGAYVSCDVILEDNVHIYHNTVIGHNGHVHRHCQISTHIVVGGNCEIGEGTFLGMSSSVKEKVRIGKNVVVGMGSVVLQDIPENVIVMGNPARQLRYKNDSRVFRDNIGGVKAKRARNGKSDLEIYDKVFMEVLRIPKEELEEAEYKVTSSWDSMGHMWLVEGLERAFGIVLAAEDVMDMDSYKKGKAVLAEHYGIKS